MPKYHVYVTYTNTATVEVEADSEYEAENKVKKIDEEKGLSDYFSKVNAEVDIWEIVEAEED
ncbi:MAG: hypothetical protein ABEI54_05280 [Candidatus Bipolaricaulia bacterium]